MLYSAKDIPPLFKPCGKMNIRKYLCDMHHTASSTKSYEYIINRYLQDNPNAESYQFVEVFQYLKEVKLENTKLQSFILLQAGIKKYYDYLIHIGKRESHPCHGLYLKHKQKQLIHQDLFKPNELAILLKRNERYALLSYRNKIMISLLIFQGLSLSEVIRVKMRHVNLDKGTVLVRQSKTLNKRVLDLTPKQLDWMNRYVYKHRPKLMHGETEFLLLNKLGNPISSDVVQYIIETFRVLFPDRKLSATTIRQSVIANWLNEYNIPLDQVQLLCGHKRLSSTLRYKEMNMKYQIELMNRYFPI